MDSKQLADNLRAAILRRDDSAEQLLHLAGSYGDVQILALTQWCVLLDERMRAAALRSLARQLSLLRAGDLAALEQRMRNPDPYVGRTHWDDLGPEDCRRLGREESSWPMLALATLHRSGYVREAALRELARAPRVEYLPFVVSRANDWVPQIREMARACVGKYLTASHASGWIDALDLIEALARARRTDHEPLVRMVYELLRSASVEPQLLAALGSHDSSVRRRCARLLMQQPTSDSLRLLSGSRDPALRLMALRAAVADRHVDDVVLQRSLRDAALPVRRRAVLEALKRELVGASRVISEFMLDASLSVRDLAREWLRKHRPDFDLAPEYRRAIGDESGRRQRIALIGLGETGGTADINVLVPYLDHELPTVRRFAVMALDALGTRVHGAVFAARLADTAAPVVRAAADALSERMDPALVPDVWRAIESGPPIVAVYAARCFGRLEAWSALVELCELIPRAPQASAHQLESWLRRHVSGFRQRPGTDVVRRAGAALRWTHGTLPERLARELEFVLRTTSE